MYWIVALVLALAAAVLLFLGFKKRNEPGEEQKATQFIIGGLVAVVLFLVWQWYNGALF